MYKFFITTSRNFFLISKIIETIAKNNLVVEKLMVIPESQNLSVYLKIKGEKTVTERVLKKVKKFIGVKNINKN